MLNKIAYVDMDNILIDFPRAFDNIFSLMEPLEGAIEPFNYLSKR
jgi:hypothetical protein